MSSFLFYSSPPRSSQHLYQASPTSFFTPQVHGSKILGWPQSFSPASPPPALRTSTNANILRSPMKANKHVRFEGENSHEDEDTNMQEDQLYAAAQDKPIIAADNTFAALPPHQTSRFQPQSLIQKPTSLLSTEQASSQQPQFRSRFQQRSRDISSPALLSTTITNARNARQSGSRFLDRLRQSRHDRRDRRGAETVEQIDFFQEKRSRAAYFEREALEEEIDVDLAEEADEVFEDVQMSPIEDKEVEDLVKRYYEEPDEREIQYSSTDITCLQDEHDADLWRGDEELEYDQAFMELLSQEEGDNGVFQTNVPAGPSSVRNRIAEINALDRDTEMS